MKRLFEDVHTKSNVYLLKETTYKGENGIAYSCRFFSVIDGWIVCNARLSARTRRIG